MITNVAFWICPKFLLAFLATKLIRLSLVRLAKFTWRCNRHTAHPVTLITVMGRGSVGGTVIVVARCSGHSYFSSSLVPA